MRKLFITLASIVLVVLMLAYIVGTMTNDAVNRGDSSVSLIEPSPSSNADRNTNELVSYESLLSTPTITHLPKSLQAGIYYDSASAAEALQRISALGYVASVTPFTDQHGTTLNIIILGPFESEAGLQVAQYALAEANIRSQRVVTPKLPETE